MFLLLFLILSVKLSELTQSDISLSKSVTFKAQAPISQRLPPFSDEKTKNVFLLYSPGIPVSQSKSKLFLYDPEEIEIKEKARYSNQKVDFSIEKSPMSHLSLFDDSRDLKFPDSYPILKIPEPFHASRSMFQLAINAKTFQLELISDFSHFKFFEEKVLEMLYSEVPELFGLPNIFESSFLNASLMALYACESIHVFLAQEVSLRSPVLIGLRGIFDFIKNGIAGAPSSFGTDYTKTFLHFMMKVRCVGLRMDFLLTGMGLNESLLRNPLPSQIFLEVLFVNIASTVLESTETDQFLPFLTDFIKIKTCSECNSEHLVEKNQKAAILKIDAKDGEDFQENVKSKFISPERRNNLLTKNEKCQHLESKSTSQYFVIGAKMIAFHVSSAKKCSFLPPEELILCEKLYNLKSCIFYYKKHYGTLIKHQDRWFVAIDDILFLLNNLEEFLKRCELLMCFYELVEG